MAVIVSLILCKYLKSKNLKTWCQSSMTDKRLDQLALGYINRERTCIDVRTCTFILVCVLRLSIYEYRI